MWKPFTSSAAKFRPVVFLIRAARALVGRGGYTVSVRSGKCKCRLMGGAYHFVGALSPGADGGHGTEEGTS